ncbi:MAG: adenylate/guanylate cyclase domain-containing protein [Acidiferrobacterales bacterium]
MAGGLKAYVSNWRRSAQHSRLPPRVSEAIRRQQESSEVLIGWIQLGVVVTFGFLYAIAPKTFTEEAEFAPVPWALGLYFAFTVLRLMLAHTNRLPDWMLYVSIVVDMLLLLGLIWSFHVQYMQPASFYLKAPTLLYVFIFIALRALRFEPRFVLVAGMVAASGWLAMVAYVIYSDPADMMVTRDYIEYMTSNSVLIGAEFDKIISILMVTSILALAIHRGRRLLIQSVFDASTAQDLSRFVPTEVVRQVRSAEQRVEAGQGVVREATILFTDIEGFTSISETLSPTDLIATLNDYFKAVVEPIEQHGGVINQFQGDAILASFNLPEPHREHAANAVRAAIEIQNVLKNQTFGGGITLRSRIGINTGTCVGGLVGTGERLGYTVHGDDVNLAARLEQLNKEYGTRVIVAETTCERAGWGRFAFQRLGEVQVRGRNKPTVIYTLPDPG